MSLITRCPACATYFKVVPDQLRVSEGWVRCGQCDEVFDANVHLHGESVALRPATSAHIPVDLLPQQEPTAPIEDRVHAVTGSALTHDGPNPEDELAAKLEWPDEPSVAEDAWMDVRPGGGFHLDPPLHLEMPDDAPAPSYFEPGPSPSAIPSEPAWDDVAPPLAVGLDLAAALAVMDARPPSPTMSESEADRPVPAFMRKDRKHSVTSHPWLYRSLLGVSIALVLALGLQVVLHERERLAAVIPSARPALIALCSVLNCQIAPFRHIESVIIDTSAFVKVRGDAYQLNLTLKNTATFEVALPAVELTLTDTRDQPLIRYVVTATQLAAQQETLAAGAELAATVPIHVKNQGSAVRISGYRLLAFYP